MSPLSGVITESWQLYKAHARHLISVAFAVYLPIAVLTLLVGLAGGFFGRLLVDLVSFVGFLLLEAALVKAIQDVRGGATNLSVGQTFSAALPSLGAVAVASVLAAIGIWIGLILIIIPGIYLATIWCLIVPAIVVENAPAMSSFGRSNQLVKGRFWNVLGTLVLVVLIVFVVEIILGLIFVALPFALAQGLAVLVAGSLVAPFGAAVITNMYFRLAAAPVGAAAGYGGPAGGPYGGQYGANPYGTAAPGTFGTQPPPAGQYGTGYAPPSQPEPGAGPNTQPDTGFPPSS
ncbi:MAG TPA: hypothetical protein VEL03_20560 [Streptosporangiaceae bacterium]|nr:hypothetical protein [Streptosporangiaceae bacterium]